MWEQLTAQGDVTNNKTIVFEVWWVGANDYTRECY